MEALQIKRIDVNPSNIDWTTLIEKAERRHPPFSVEGEKGFRDALILESVHQLAETIPLTRSRVVLVTADDLLTTSFSHRFASRQNLRVEPTLDSVLTLINTLRSEIDENTLQDVLVKASLLFFDKDNPSCLYKKANIVRSIFQVSANVVNSVPEHGFEITDSKIYIGKPTFLNKEGQRITLMTKIRVVVKATKITRRITEYGTVLNPSFAGGTRNALYPGNPLYPVAWSHTPNIQAGGGLVGAITPNVGIASLSDVSLSSASLLGQPTVEPVEREGTHVFEALWEVTLSTNQRLVRPKVVEIKHVETTWGS